MANRYWIASSAGSWNNTANWSATSGGAGGTSVPGANDVAIFESGSVGCTIADPILVGGLTTSGWSGTFTISGTLSVTGDVTIGSTTNVSYVSGGKLVLAGTQNQEVYCASNYAFVFTLNKPAGTLKLSGRIRLKSDLLRDSSQIDPRTATLVDIEIVGSAQLELVGDVACRSLTTMLGNAFTFYAGVTLDTYSFNGATLGSGTIRVCRGQYTNTGSQGSSINVIYWDEPTHPPPATPTGFTATPVSSSQINLSWNAATNATGYKVQRSTNQTTWTDVYTGSNTSASATGLSENTLYYFQLAAYNSDMAYSNYATTSAKTLQEAPGVPTGVSVSSSSTTQISVSWNAVSGSTGYELQISTNSTFTTGLQTFSPSGTSQTVTGLTAGTTYYARVKAKNAGGDSAFSSPASGVTLCDAPTGVTATPKDQSTDITILWNAVTGAASYTVEWSTTSGGSYTALPSATGTSTTHAVGTNNTERFYRVKAVNASGNSANSSVASTKTPPAAPVPLTATVQSTTQINLSLTAPAGATKHKFEYKTKSGSTWNQVGTPGAGTTCNVTGLTPDTEYDFRASSDNL